MGEQRGAGKGWAPLAFTQLIENAMPEQQVKLEWLDVKTQSETNTSASRFC